MAGPKELTGPDLAPPEHRKPVQAPTDVLSDLCIVENLDLPRNL